MKEYVERPSRCSSADRAKEDLHRLRPSLSEEYQREMQRALTLAATQEAAGARRSADAVAGLGAREGRQAGRDAGRADASRRRTRAKAAADETDGRLRAQPHSDDRDIWRSALLLGVALGFVISRSVTKPLGRGGRRGQPAGRRRPDGADRGHQPRRDRPVAARRCRTWWPSCRRW